MDLVNLQHLYLGSNNNITDNCINNLRELYYLKVENNKKITNIIATRLKNKYEMIIKSLEEKALIAYKKLIF